MKIVVLISFLLKDCDFKKSSCLKYYAKDETIFSPTKWTA